MGNISNSKISEELSTIIKENIQTSSDEQTRVIIHLDENADLEDAKNTLKNLGLKIENVIEGPILIVSGSISVKDISSISKESAVKKIEYDGKIHALTN